MASIQRGLISRDDVAHWDGVTRTTSRVDATGGTETGLNFGDEVDILQVFGSGTDRTLSTVNDAITRLGGANATLLFSTGTWTITENLTIPSNVRLYFPFGAVLSVTSGKTLTINGSVDAGFYQIFSGAGTVSGFGASGPVYPLWWGAVGDSSTDDTTPIQAAFDSGGDVIFPFGYSFRIATPGVDVSSNTDIWIQGKIVITSAILAASVTGAIRIENKSNVHLHGGAIDASGFATYDNNIIRFDGNTDSSILFVVITDSDQSRVPLCPIRSANNTRCQVSFNTFLSVADNALTTNTDKYCRFIGNAAFGGAHTAYETTTGEHNVWLGNIGECTNNTTVSALSFNDKWSIAVGNIMVGGAFNITSGHVNTQSDHSVVAANVCDLAATNGIQIQYSTNSIVGLNAIDGTGTNAFLSESNSKFNTVIGNTVAGTWTVGFKIGNYTTAIGNIATETATGYRNAVDGSPGLYVGNMAINGSAVGFDWGVSADQDLQVAIGNFAGDDQGSPTQTFGFKS